MRALFLSLVVFLVGAFSAEASAQCLRIGSGWVSINHRTGYLYGGNFVARVSCSRGAPVYVYWRGGYMCVGSYFYGTSAYGNRFSCLVRGLRYR